MKRMEKYVISDEQVSETVEADSMEDALEQAREWLLGVEWGTSQGTIRVSATVTGPHGEEREAAVTIDPEEPECPEGDEHDWQRPHELVGGLEENPGVWGHGGGITSIDVCMRCGLRKLVDTWADDGHGGHMESTRYEQGEVPENPPELVARMSNDEVWDAWVGSQSTSDWAEYARNDRETPRESVDHYMPHVIQTQREADGTDLAPYADDIARKLLGHLVDCGAALDEDRWVADLEEELVYSKRLQTVGNSLCVIVDRSVADALGVDRGDWVQVTIRRV